MCEQEVGSGICSLAVGANLAFPKSIGFVSCTHLARNPREAESSWRGVNTEMLLAKTLLSTAQKWTDLICYSQLLPRMLHFGGVLLAQTDCRVITVDSIKPDRERERPLALYSEHEKCYPVLIEATVAVATAQLTVTSCISSSSGGFKQQRTAATASYICGNCREANR